MKTWTMWAGRQSTLIRMALPEPPSCVKKRDTSPRSACSCRAGVMPAAHGKFDLMEGRSYPLHGWRRGCWKQVRSLFAPSILVILLPLLLLMPPPAYANPVTALEIAIGTLKLAGALTTATKTLVDIFGGDVSKNNDNPLYSIGQSSPSLTISATEETFDLLLKQTNDVSEFEDDFSAVLSGVTQVPTDRGPTDAWMWKITMEADINTLAFPQPNTELDAQGFVAHLNIPKDHINETSPAPGLNYDLSVSKTATGFSQTFTQSILTDMATNQTLHPLGSHSDVLNPAELTAECCSTFQGNIDFFNVHLHAVHAPEPSTFLLLATGVIGLAGAGKSWRNRRRVDTTGK